MKFLCVGGGVGMVGGMDCSCCLLEYIYIQKSQYLGIQISGTNEAISKEFVSFLLLPQAQPDDVSFLDSDL